MKGTLQKNKLKENAHYKKHQKNRFPATLGLNSGLVILSKIEIVASEVCICILAHKCVCVCVCVY
jgi:hypothetical protein